MNFAKGILEVRKQTYRHLQLILKAVPLQTPTEIELGAKLRIRVTLFDANHCPGAVMFLIEGDGKAILYTGDIRAEAWWVNAIIRSPVLIPYTLGQKRLGCIYLDTTFATKDDVYQDFPSKATGLQELLQRVERCPPETVFYFRAWTLGYEDVWIALSAALGSKIHVDEYQSRLYRSLSEDSRDGFSVLEAPALNGFQAGNHTQPGCLTMDSSGVRVHSCEPGSACHAKLTKNKDTVWITPIITRSRDGADVYEIGAGAGAGDLYQTAELDVADFASTEALANLCVEWIKDPEELSNALQRLSSAHTSRNSKMSLDDLGLDSDAGISLKQLVSRMASYGDYKNAGKEGGGFSGLKVSNNPSLSDAINFPYARHASYHELRDLVSAFKPRDICSCTVDEETWSEEVSMQTLFGDLCSESYFIHDRMLRSRLQDRNEGDETGVSRKRKREDQQDTQDSGSIHEACETANGSFERHVTEAGLVNPLNRRRTSEDLLQSDLHDSAVEVTDEPESEMSLATSAFESQPLPEDPQDRGLSGLQLDGISQDQTELLRHKEHSRNALGAVSNSKADPENTTVVRSPVDAQTSMRKYAIKEAYRAARRCLLDGADTGGWEDLSLRSVGRRGHTEAEIEL